VPGATIRIAILAQAARARAEMTSTGEAASKMGDRIKKAEAAAGAAAGAALVAGIAGALAQNDVTAKLQTQLGTTAERAGELGKVAGSLYARNFGTDLAQVGEAIRGVQQNIGSLGEGAQGGIEGLTSKVLTLSNTFEQDLGGTSAAVGQLLRNGLARDADEALDIVTAGLQSGANKADDLLDTFTEYGTQFRKFGLDGKVATGLLSQGLKAGARDADTVADAIKEFSIRAIDGSKATVDGFKGIGLNAKKMQADIAGGGPRAAAALDLTLDRLRAVKNPAERSRLAVELFGTKAEDLGNALFALDPSTAVAGLGNVAGAAQRASDAMGSAPAAKIEAFKRSLTQGLAEAVGQLAGFAMANQSWLVPLIATLGSIAAGLWLVSVALKAWPAIQAAASAATAIWTGAQWLLNAALAANPIGLIVLAIAALIAIVIIAWKNSTTFRTIVTGAFNAVLSAARAAWTWLKGNWPLLLAIITGPIGLAVRLVVQHWDAITAAARAIPGKIRAVFSGIGGLLTAAGRAVVQGFLNGLRSMFGPIQDAFNWLTSKIPSWKGPAGKDSRLLYGAGQLVLGGFQSGLESQYAGAKASLGGFTDSLAGTSAAVTGSVEVSTAAPAWAQRLEALLSGGLRISLESSGSRGDDAVLELIRDRVRVKGGKASTLGITS
jgi:phage-related minor tail protein